MTSSIADFVVSLGSDGHIRSQGTVSDALSKDSKLVKELKEEKEAIKQADKELNTDQLDEAADEDLPKKTDGKVRTLAFFILQSNLDTTEHS
jgi:hypothetical protein